MLKIQIKIGDPKYREVFPEPFALFGKIEMAVGGKVLFFRKHHWSTEEWRIIKSFVHSIARRLVIRPVFTTNKARIFI